MKLEDLVILLKIEEDNKTGEKKYRENSTIMGANIVEETAPKSKKRKRSSGQTKEHNKKKFKGSCYNYGKTSDKASDCRLPKKNKKKGQANIVEKNDDIDDLCAMLSECNLVGNSKEWWIDSRATRHVCAVKEAFATYSTAGPEEVLSMENAATAKIEVTRITSIRVFVALAAVYGLEIHQLDIKTAFLNGELEEDIYIEQPEGFVVPGKEKKMCKLVKVTLWT
ncbi:uncharacterized protein [Nicotiana tomentosiformis]|uniref:uncharacterized protein n=1 Tax=Nicotiana tomentosiformis TaxID=4098 RepID=UPI00388C79E2